MSWFFSTMFHGFGNVIKEVTIAIVPILAIFLFLHFRALHVRKRQFKTIMFGFALFYVGLLLLMQGIHVAFLPIGSYMGRALASMENNWILLPIGFVIGFLTAFAEPAVHVMIKQVEEMTSGAIKSKIMLTAISVGVALAVVLGMARMLYQIPLMYILVPGYLLVFVLSFFADVTFVGMAFDNGGVATGPMCSTFVLALSLQVADTLSGGGMSYGEGFGIIALVALAPVLTTLILGFMYRRKSYRKQKNPNKEPINSPETVDTDIKPI